MSEVITIQGISLPQIIQEGNAQLLVTQAQAFGAAAFQGGLTKSQIRGIFGTVRQIDAGWDKNTAQQNLRKVLLLKPRLAYQAAREPKVRPLADVLSSAIDLVAQGKDPGEQRTRFDYFVDLFEAILAYHTAAGGK